MGYTEGEWKVLKSATNAWIICAENELICHEVRHYNAYLIAAAPEMYEALKGFLEAVKLGLSGEYYRALMRKALAKAEGR